MTYLEVISIIGQRQEQIIYDRINAIQTNIHLYSRAGNSWEEKEVVGIVDPNQRLPMEFAVKHK